MPAQRVQRGRRVGIGEPGGILGPVHQALQTPPALAGARHLELQVHEGERPGDVVALEAVGLHL